ASRHDGSPSPATDNPRRGRPCMRHLTTSELEAGLEEIRESPRDGGVLELIVRRPEVEAREVLDEGRLDLIEGLAGDNWRTRGSSRTPDRSAHPDMQLNVMNAR